MVDRISKKFELDKMYNLPKKKDVRFKIETFEMNPNKVVVKLSRAFKQRELFETFLVTQPFPHPISRKLKFLLIEALSLRAK